LLGRADRNRGEVLDIVPLRVGLGAAGCPLAQAFPDPFHGCFQVIRDGNAVLFEDSGVLNRAVSDEVGVAHLFQRECA
jgi:hypothetical protein